MTKKSVTKILTERIRESLKVDRMIESGILGQDAEHIRLTRTFQDARSHVSCFVFSMGDILLQGRFEFKICFS